MPTRKPLCVALALLGLAGVTRSYASCSQPSYVDQFGVVARGVFDHGGVNACPEADLHQQLYTREGTLTCASKVNLTFAMASRDHGWVFIPLAGMKFSSGRSEVRAGTSVSPEFLGCAVKRDGVPLSVFRSDGSIASTTIGWLSLVDVRNPKEGETPAK